MTVMDVEGFKVYEDIDRRCVIVQSERIHACLDFYYAGNFDGIWINKMHGYELDNVDFLEEHPDLRHVEIMQSMKSLRGLHALSKLKYLLVSDNQVRVDFSCFRELESLYAEWSPKFQNLDQCSNLRRMSLRKFKPKQGNADLTGLSKLLHLEELGIVQSPITSLSGLGRLQRLRKLELSHLTKLGTIDEIDRIAGSLEFLMFGVCRKIQNHEFVKVMHNLRVLAFNDCGEMQSIGFIRDMPCLRDFRFVNTNVLDGDMTPCIGLENAGFFKKRHFSHSREEIEALRSELRAASDAAREV